MEDWFKEILESLRVCPPAQFGTKQVTARLEVEHGENVLRIFLPGLCISVWEEGVWEAERDGDG